MVFQKGYKIEKGQHISPKTEFKKGQIPWNKGTVGVMKFNKTTFKKGNKIGKETRFNSEKTTGKNNSKWKGNDVGYFGLHTWIARRLGKAKRCIKCKTIKNIEWANKSHKYRREINDWIELCRKHHCEYDKNYWGLATRKYGL